MNDPDLADEPEALLEVHAIRLKIHDPANCSMARVEAVH
jgi:hypothetical protein